MAVLRAAVWLARRLGRRLSRALIWPVCLGFALCSPAARAASRGYLARALGQPAGGRPAGGRPARGRDVLRHFAAFGATVLDRVYLLNDEAAHFDIAIAGEAIVTGLLAQGDGCLLLGAHLGSFEVLRLVGRRQPGLQVSLAMFEATGRRIGAALNAINPLLAPRLIGLGTPGAMLAMRDCLGRGGFVGMLADRTLPGDATLTVDFLGAPAAFPTGPARLAALLQVPVVLMVGLYRGGRRYEIHFERLDTPATGAPADIAKLVEAYAARIAVHCRAAPFNWFNFFDFWA